MTDLDQSGEIVLDAVSARFPAPPPVASPLGQVDGALPESVADCRPVGVAELVLRRTMDVVVAVLSLVVFAVPMLVIALIVKATSPGPALFGQARVGRHGEPIRVLKFRSMRDGADELLEQNDELRALFIANDFKLHGDQDPRITRVGRFLRKTSLDELPQLWNVLRGDMSIVGIRPLFFDQLAQRPRYDQELYRRLRPGMTGLWQVSGRSSVHPVDRMALDRTYVETWSLLRDIWILAKTPFAVLQIHRTH